MNFGSMPTARCSAGEAGVRVDAIEVSGMVNRAAGNVTLPYERGLGI